MDIRVRFAPSPTAISMLATHELQYLIIYMLNLQVEHLS